RSTIHCKSRHAARSSGKITFKPASVVFQKLASNSGLGHASKTSPTAPDQTFAARSPQLGAGGSGAEVDAVAAASVIAVVALALGFGDALAALAAVEVAVNVGATTAAGAVEVAAAMPAVD